MWPLEVMQPTVLSAEKIMLPHSYVKMKTDGFHLLLLYTSNQKEQGKPNET